MLKTFATYLMDDPRLVQMTFTPSPNPGWPAEIDCDLRGYGLMTISCVDDHTFMVRRAVGQQRTVQFPNALWVSRRSDGTYAVTVEGDLMREDSHDTDTVTFTVRKSRVNTFIAEGKTQAEAYVNALLHFAGPHSAF